MGYYWIVKYILFMTLVLLIVFYNIATILLTALMWLETKLKVQFILDKVLEITIVQFIEWNVDLSLTALFYIKYGVDSH